MLKIEAVYIKRIEDKSRLCADIRWNNRKRTLWVQVDREYENYLCYERADAFLVALLPFAMLNNLDIEVDIFVSERLLYQVTSLLLPALSSNIREFHFINITAKVDNTILASQNAVGTGLSCGVDSFYTVLKHMHTELEDFNLTHLTYFNIMNSSIWKDYGEDCSRDFSRARIRYVKPAAEALGLTFLPVDTNFDLMYRDLKLLETFSFRYFGVILSLQKLFKTYYWSSSYSVSQFKLSISDTEFFDLLNVQCVSTENTVFYSTGSEVTRLEKTKYISDFKITYEYLNVCWYQIHNCTSDCDKCRRTMVSLFALGKLDCYGKVFNLDYFYNHFDDYIGYMLFGSTQADINKWYSEILRLYLDNNHKISKKAKIYAIKLKLKALKKSLLSII